MSKQSVSRWIFGTLTLALAPAGCSALLGLDEFTESAATSGSGTGSGGSGGGGGSGGAASSSTGGSVPTGPWSKTIAGEVVPRGIAADSKANVYITGSFRESIQFEPAAPLLSAGGDDIFLVKLDQGGKALWAKRFGKGQGDFSNAITVNAEGAVVVAGSLGSSVNLGGVDLQPGAFAAKFDTNGNHACMISLA